MGPGPSAGSGQQPSERRHLGAWEKKGEISLPGMTLVLPRLAVGSGGVREAGQVLLWDDLGALVPVALLCKLPGFWAVLAVPPPAFCSMCQGGF